MNTKTNAPHRCGGRDIIYISGPITDLTTGQPRENWEQLFNDAEKALRALGWKVINPVVLAQELKARRATPPTNADYLMSDLKTIHQYADRIAAVYVIGSHTDVIASAGVMAECALAKTLGIPTIIDFTGVGLTMPKPAGEYFSPRAYEPRLMFFSAEGTTLEELANTNPTD